jgi:hypothetical protein
MTKGAPSVRTYPFDLIRIAYSKCGRKGQYWQETLLNRFQSRSIHT